MVTNPSDCRRVSASRTGTRDTPYRLAIASSTNRSPPARRPVRISSRKACAMESPVDSTRETGSDIMRSAQPRTDGHRHLRWRTRQPEPLEADYSQHPPRKQQLHTPTYAWRRTYLDPATRRCREFPKRRQLDVARTQGLRTPSPAATETLSTSARKIDVRPGIAIGTP